MNSRSTLPHSLLLSTVLLVGLRAAPAATFSLNPSADAFVATGPTGNLRDNNYGGGGALVVAAAGLPEGEFQTVLRFDLSTTLAAMNAQFGSGGWSIEAVQLVLTTSAHGNAIYNPPAAGGFGVSLMQDNAWVEGTGTASAPGATGITYNQLVNLLLNPAADQDLGNFRYGGDASATTGYALNLSSGLTTDILSGGQASLRLYATDEVVSYLFTSRSSSDPSVQPALVITVVPEPGAAVIWALGATAVWWRFRRGARSCRPQRRWSALAAPRTAPWLEKNSTQLPL